MSDLRNQSAYAYPSPASHVPRADISLREILDTYRENNELLKQILVAKAEEDKRRAEEEKYKVEQVRLQCKQVELEMLKEQKKPPTILTGVPPLNTGYNVKSPSDLHSPYLPIPQPMDSHFSTTTPTSATRLSPPSSGTTGHDNVTFGSHSGMTAPHNHSYHNSVNQRPALTLSIPSFPILSPTATHNPHSFTQTPAAAQDSSQSSTSHPSYSQSPTTVTTNSNNKRPKPSEPEVDHEYVMEALRQKVRQNAENPAKKYIKVLKPRSSSMPVPANNQNQHHHQQQSQSHQQSSQQQQQQQQSSSHQQQQSSSSSPPPPNSAPIVNSPIPQQLPPMNVHSPQMNQEPIPKS